MSNLNDFNREAKAALRVALQWRLLAVPTGLVCGVVGTAFHLSVEYVTELRAAQSWLLLCLPLAGLAIVALYKVTKCEGVGTNNVIRAVQGVQSDELVLNGFTTVVDANKCKMYMKNFGEFFNNQVENASAIILSRTEGIRPEKLDAAVALLREKNPTATIVTTPWTELDGKQILQTMERRDTLSAELEHLKAEAAEEEHAHEHHHHDHDEEHEHHHHHDGQECDDPACSCHHHHHHADEVFTSWGAETPKQFTQADIDRILTALDSGDYGAILRAKGIVPAADGQWLHFDYVPQEHEVRYGSADYTGRLCVIGSQLKEDGLKTLFGL